MDAIIGLGITGGLLGLGFVVGGNREKAHFASLDSRELATTSVMVTDLKTFPMACPDTTVQMYVGQVVIATDYFKSMIAGLATIIGGELSTYQTLVTRARREALLRVIEQAQADGFNAVCNIRFETSNIAAAQGNKGAAAVEMLCSGTAYKMENPSV